MLTVGYGDIHPTNTGERFFALVTMLAGSLIFGGIIAKVKEVIEGRNLLSKEISNKEQVLKSLLEEKIIPLALKNQCKEAYSYYIKLRPDLAETGLYNELPKDLKLRLIQHAYHREIVQINVFRDATDRAFVAHLIIHSRPFTADLGQIIYDEGDVAEDMTFLLRGSVRITQQGLHGADRLLGYSTAGNVFGDLEYYKPCSLRSARYQAVRSSVMYSIDYPHIKEAVDEYFEAGVKLLGYFKSRYDNFRRVVREPPRATFHMRHTPAKASVRTSLTLKPQPIHAQVSRNAVGVVQISPSVRHNPLLQPPTHF